MYLRKKMRRCFSLFLACFIACSYSLTALAHSQCIASGAWAFNDQEHLMIYIDSSAVTTASPQYMYSAINQWNDISSHVHVSWGFPAPQVNLYGKNVIYGGTIISKVPGDIILGSIKYYGSNNQPVVPGVISYVTIVLNTNYFNSLSANSSPTPVACAKKTMLHEIGHALQLEHPVSDSSLSLHIYNGLPKCVMNQGLPDYNAIYGGVTNHDRDQIIENWGS